MTTNNLIARELGALADYLLGKELKEPFRIVSHFDKRTLTKIERETYAPRDLKSYYINIINGIFVRPNESKFTIHFPTRSKHGTFYAEGKRSNLSVIFSVNTTDKDSKYPCSTYKVVFKDKSAFLMGLKVYTALAIQHEGAILRSKLKAYFTYLELL